MRAKKVPAWASNLNFSTGPAVGLPTKIVPTTGTFQNGFLPGEPIGAQYDAYWRHHIGRQTELSAKLAFRSLLPISGFSPMPSLPLASVYFSGGGTTFFQPGGGVTFFATADANKLYYVPTNSSNATNLTFTPSSGSFLSRTLVVDENGVLLVFGTNGTAPSNTLWTGSGIVASFTERGMPVSGGCYKSAYDRGNNKTYAFFEDSNRSVYRVSTGGTVTTLAATRPGKPAFAGTMAAVAVNKDVAIVARISGGVVVIDYATLSTTTPPSTWTTVNVTDGAASPTTVFDLRWSDSYQCWMLLADDHIWAFTNPAGPFTRFVASPGGAGVISGALFDVGSALLYKTGTVRELYVRDDLDNPTISPETLSLGAGYSGDGFVSYDGSALFVTGALSVNWLRTLRVS